MKRWHLLPAQLYTAVEQAPGTVLLESAAPADSHPASSPLTRLFTVPLRVCVANHRGELAALFAEIESAVAAGLYAAGYFSYECAAFFEPKLAA
jgi:para-aminobenzoate synthetase/4-amino-4-deoxychorismate lyase